MKRKIKILIVDDEAPICLLLKRYLERIGFQTFVATDGEQALDIVREEKPAIMTLDIRMPGLNGYEVLEKVKRRYPEMFIIVISAIDVPNMEEILERSGAHALLHKPIELQKLSDIICGFVGICGKPLLDKEKGDG
ncbi:MAG: response regulator [Desulfurivibrionaceae bacterium]|jgi:CheY-like chemotaxis protein